MTRDCEHGRQIGKCADCEVIRLEALNAELLEALQTIMGDGDHGQNMTWAERCQQARAAIVRANAAIAKAEGQK